MTQWHATVTYDRAVSDDQAGQIAGRGEYTTVAVHRDRDRTTIGIGVEAGTLRQATDAAQRLARELTAGIVTAAPVALRVLTEDELAAELAEPQIPALVDSTGARELLGGISQPRLFELRQTRDDFPDPVATFAGERHVWTEASILGFAKRWDRRPGRPRLGPEVRTQRRWELCAHPGCDLPATRVVGGLGYCRGDHVPAELRGMWRDA